jgi:transposase
LNTRPAILDHTIGISIFEPRYGNDETGTATYDMVPLLKTVLYAYARAIASSGLVERGCREDVIFMALLADIQPHFTAMPM